MKSKIKTIKTRKTMIQKDEIDQDEIYNKVRRSAFKQQRLPAWRPVPTITSILIVLPTFSVIFIAIGIILLIFSQKIKHITYQYDEICKELNKECHLEIEITEDMSQPIMVYYQLDGFFQNHRRYLKSKNLNQLRGNSVTKDDVKDDCDPIITNKDIGKTNNVNGKPDLNENEVAIPCGLMAKTFFNDTFFDWKIDGKNITVDEKNIAYAKDLDLYKKEIDTSKQWMSLTDEHFIVWMRPSGLPNPKKLWGRIRQDLKKGNKLTLKVQNNYDVSIYEGKKKLVFSTTNFLGGKNVFLGVSFVVVGCLTLALTVLFFVGYKIMQKKEKMN